MVAWYRAFFASGRFVSRTPATLSILQCSFPAAMKRDSSLQTKNVEFPFNLGLGTKFTELVHLLHIVFLRTHRHIHTQDKLYREREEKETRMHRKWLTNQ